MQTEARELDAGLLYVILPPIELVMPDKITMHTGAAVREVMASGVQQKWYDWFRGAVEAAGIETIDLLPSFRKDGRQRLYANDMHL